MYNASRNAYWEGQLMAWGPRILIAILIIVATWLVARAVKWALQKAVAKTPALQKNTPGNQHETIGAQLGTIAKLFIWLVGIMAALTFLGIGQILAPVNQLTTEVFAFLPRLVGAGLIFFIGYIVARIVQRLIETTLTAINLDGLLARIGVGDTEGTVRAAPDAVPPGAAPGATRASVARALGIVAFAFVIIPAAIAAINVLGIDAITVPATNMLNEFLLAIPRVLLAVAWIGGAFIVGKFLRSIIETVLPPAGFDRFVGALNVMPATATPSRIVGLVAMTAVMLFGLMEAAKTIGGDASAALLFQIAELGGKVIFGTVIIVAGLFLARILSNLVGSSTGESGYAQTIVKFSIIALFTAIGLTFMGLADQIVMLAFGLILGSAAVATAVAFGLGGREFAARVLDDWYSGTRNAPPAAPPTPRIASTPPPAETSDRQPPLV